MVTVNNMGIVNNVGIVINSVGIVVNSVGADSVTFTPKDLPSSKDTPHGSSPMVFFCFSFLSVYFFLSFFFLFFSFLSFLFFLIIFLFIFMIHIK
jgi:hypothetical protein